MVEERVKHIAEWYSFQGKLSGVNPRPLRSMERKEEEDPLLCKWPGCGRRCKSKGGLAIHIRRMHDQEKAKMEFPCDFYGMIFKSMNTMINHCKSCGHCLRRTPTWEDMKHRWAYTSGEEGGGARVNVRPEDWGQAAVYRPKQKPFPECGRVLSATNMARQLRSSEGC